MIISLLLLLCPIPMKASRFLTACRRPPAEASHWSIINKSHIFETLVEEVQGGLFFLDIEGVPDKPYLSMSHWVVSSSLRGVGSTSRRPFFTKDFRDIGTPFASIFVYNFFDELGILNYLIKNIWDSDHLREICENYPGNNCGPCDQWTGHTCGETWYLVDGEIKAIMPVHLFGLCADMSKIMELAKKYRLKVIEDSACSLGAWIGRPHSGTFGDAGCFSFHQRKSITTGEGGMIVID